MERFNKQIGLTLCVWVCVCFRNSSSAYLSTLVCLHLVVPITGWLEEHIYHTGVHAYTRTHTRMHPPTQTVGSSPAVTPHSRQMGDICSLEIFLHYCHRGTSLNVCFPAPVLMRMCLLKWWSTWQRTFTRRHARTDHTCDSVLSSPASSGYVCQMHYLRCSEQGQRKSAAQLHARYSMPYPHGVDIYVG